MATTESTWTFERMGGFRGFLPSHGQDDCYGKAYTRGEGFTPLAEAR